MRNILGGLRFNIALQAGVPNLLDRGVLNVGRKRGLHKNVEVEWAFLDEIPFDFERRMLSVMLRPAGKALPMLVTKVCFLKPCLLILTLLMSPRP